MKVLILEDNQFDADLTFRQVSKDFPDCEIKLASTISEAWELIQKKFDVALLDVKLPDGYGMDLLIELQEKNNNIIILMLTGSGDEEMAVSALKSGADDYIIKKNDYLSTIKDIINFNITEKTKKLRYTSQVIHVLYLEHHSSDIDLTLFHFKRFAPNFKIHAITTGEEALKLLPVENTEVGKYHILLMDYKLPGINAIELAKIVRQERKLDIPIVIVTGQGNEEVAIQALKLGIDEYLVKRENYLYRLPSLLTSAYQKHLLRKQNVQLAESEEKFRSIFEDHSAIKLIINPENGEIVSANKAAEKFYGWSIQELTKMTIFDINTSPTAEINERINKVRNQQEMQFELQHKSADGSIRDVKIFSSKVILKGKDYLHSIIYDISLRKKAEKQLKLLSTSIEQSPISVLITNVNGDIEYVNPYFSELSGYEFNEAIGKNPRILSSGVQTKDFYKILWETILAGIKWQGEICNKKKNGEIYWENAIISPVKDENGNIMHFVGVKEDITAKKKMIDELIMAKEKAEESDRLKSSFLANMSHEIRTPMNGIIGFTNLLASENIEHESRMRYSSFIKSSANRLLVLLTDILDISRIESGILPLEKTHFNLDKLLDQIEEETIITLEKEQKSHLNLKFIREKKASEKIIFSDQSRIHQIISNILNNAIRFTEKGSIELGYRFVNDIVEVYIKDTGIGINKDKQALIFERFRQEDDSVTRPYDGAGLGLTISKHLVEALGGELKVESEKDKGSIFTFTFQIKNSELEKVNLNQKYISDSADLNLQGKLIYIADDDLISCLYLEEILNESKVQIKLAKNGQELLNLITKKKPDLILLDINMPVMDGFATIKEIRKIYPEIPVIAQTAYAMAKEKQKILESGCDGYISKPIDKDELFEEIQGII